MVVPIGYAASSTVRVAISAFNAVDHAFDRRYYPCCSLCLSGAATVGFVFGLGVFLGLVVAAFISSLLGIRCGRVDQSGGGLTRLILSLV